MPQSLDSVLADVDASDQEIGNETVTQIEPENEPEGHDQEQSEGEERGRDAQGALHAERNRVRRKYTDTVADFDRRLTEANAGFEKKLTESLAENDRKWEQRFNQFATQIQPRQQAEPERPAERPDFYEKPDEFVDFGVRSAVDPVKAEVSQLREFYSRREAIRDHGQEKVQAAFDALKQAANSGDPEARATVAKVKQSMDPYGDIVAWHQRTSVISEVGTDPQAFIQRKLDEALNDPAFLAKAAEKLRGGTPSRQPAAKPTALPSLNRVTAAADEDEEEEDAREVFNSALRAGTRR